MAINRIFPDGLNRPTNYTPVVRAGDTVYIAGQTATDDSGNVVGLGDFEAQAQRVYQNIGTTLASVGATFANLVKTTTYLTRAEDIETYRQVRVRNMSENLPSSTLLVISRLARPELLIEIEAVAVLN